MGRTEVNGGYNHLRYKDGASASGRLGSFPADGALPHWPAMFVTPGAFGRKCGPFHF
ncbi:MAG: hypothetical protein WAO35_02145 [Terriglobia bacterium]